MGWFEPIGLFLILVFSKTKSRHWHFPAYCIDPLYSVSLITRQVNFSEISWHWDLGVSIFRRVCAVLVYKWRQNYYLVWLYTKSFEYFPFIYAIFSFWCISIDFVRMRECIELPNMCDLNRIPGMLSDILAANDKNIFPPRKRNIIFWVVG